jgi:hypothetical protein
MFLDPDAETAERQGTLTCQGCGATFATEQELQRHNAETHGGGSTGRNTDELPSDG